MLCPMLPYERRVVAALLTTPDAGQRQRVTEFVGGSLGAMPEILRFGIASAKRRLASRYNHSPASIRKILSRA